MATQMSGVIDAVSIGNQHCDRGRWEDAIKAFELATKFHPTKPNLFFLLGNAQRKVGQVDEAIANYRKALELGHEDSEGVSTALNEALVDSGAVGQVDSAPKSTRDMASVSDERSEIG